MKPVIILASSSIWRRRLLKKHGINVKVHVSKFKEMKMHKNPRILVLHNARGKARRIAAHYKSGIIIGVDTVGVFKGKILGKPNGRKAAQRMLKMLFGHTHQIMTGLCLINTQNGKELTAVVTTKMTFRKVTDLELAQYLDGGEWKGKAGSYAIQGRAKKFVQKVEGELTNVVGVPVNKLKEMLVKIQKPLV
ncbi:MAG: nucleoside triphosphate pyrophosphatase [Patescibacteria group bacterium]